MFSQQNFGLLLRIYRVIDRLFKYPSNNQKRESQHCEKTIKILVCIQKN